MRLQLDAAQLAAAAAEWHVPEKPDSGHIDTISITARVRRGNWNAMKPRIQCVPAQWIRGFTASRSRLIFMINSS